MPHYYVMPLEMTMPQTIAMDMEDEADPDATRRWLSDDELDVYVEEWSRTGFQAALNFYRVATDPSVSRHEMLAYAGKPIVVPCQFLSGTKDWGNFQEPGALQKMKDACTNFRGIKAVEGAGHWPQQEAPGRVVSEILAFIWQVDNPRLQTPCLVPASPPPRHVSAAPPKYAALRSAPIRSGHASPRTGYAHQLEQEPEESFTDMYQKHPANATRRHSSQSSSRPYVVGTENDEPSPHQDRTIASTIGQVPRSAKIGVEPPRRLDTPIVGPRSQWNDKTLFSAIHGRKLSADTRSRIASEASRKNDESYREVMEKVQRDLNRTHTPFETTPDAPNRDDEGYEDY